MSLSDNRDRLLPDGDGVIRALRPKLQSGDFSWIPVIERAAASADLALTGSSQDVTGAAIVYTPKVRHRVAVIGQLDVSSSSSPMDRLFSRARRFDGVDDYVSFGDVADQASSFSVETWARAASATGVVRLVSKDDGATAGGWNVSRFGGTWSMRLRNGTTLHSGGVVVPGEWVHLAFVFDDAADTEEIFVNGVSTGAPRTETATVANVAINLTVGSAPGGAAEFFDGDLAEIRIWSRALTVREIRANMNRRLSGLEPNLDFYWQCNDPVSTTADPIVGPGATPTGTEVVNAAGAATVTGLIDVSPTPLNSFGGDLAVRLIDGRQSAVWVNVFELERDVEHTIKLQASSDGYGSSVIDDGSAITLVGVNRPTL